MDRLIKAFNFGEQKHAGQVRRESGASYFSHPVAVSYILIQYKSSKNILDLIVACYLHDVLEDTDCTQEEIIKEFGELVGSLVVELTNDPVQVKRLGKLEYQKTKLMEMSSYGLAIKLADRLHNVSDHPTQKMLRDTLSLVDYVRTHRALTVPHTMMIRDIISTINTQLKDTDNATK